MQKFVSKPTLNDIARELSVTPSTVPRALNNHNSISSRTKLEVRKTASRLNYHPNKIASSLRIGKSKIVGVIIPSAEINFFGSIVHGIEKIASEKGYNVLMFQSNEEMEIEKKGIITFLRSGVDCILASISKETTDLKHFTQVKRRGVPLIIFDRANDELNTSSVVIDDYAGAFTATQHLIEQGCRRIAHIAGQQHVSIFKQRLNGYLDALKKHGFTIDDSLIKYGRVTIDSGIQCMNQLLSLEHAPDAVFAVEDFTALGAIQAIKAAGKKIPFDVAIVGFANEGFGQYITPSLSTVDQQTIKMGEEAAKLFFDASDNHSFYEEAPKKITLKPELIIRESSRRI